MCRRVSVCYHMSACNLDSISLAEITWRSCPLTPWLQVPTTKQPCWVEGRTDLVQSLPWAFDWLEESVCWDACKYLRVMFITLLMWRKTFHIIMYSHTRETPTISTCRECCHTLMSLYNNSVLNFGGLLFLSVFSLPLLTPTTCDATYCVLNLGQAYASCMPTGCHGMSPAVSMSWWMQSETFEASTTW